VGHGAKVLIEQALAHFDTSADIDALLPRFLAFYEANIAVNSTPYPDVVTTLQTLRRSHAKLAVVTNKLTHLTETLLATIQMRDLFDLVVCGDTTPTPKPDPAPVQYCLDRFGVAAADALYVGDSETDVVAAKAARVPVVCVRDGYNHGIDVATLEPDGIIDTFAELLL
jgi:phosphoglycolate phosphatase